MKKTPGKLEPIWEMHTQWSLKSSSGTTGTTQDVDSAQTDVDWLGESRSALLSDEISEDLSRLEQKYANFVTTNSRYQMGRERRSQPE